MRRLAALVVLAATAGLVACDPPVVEGPQVGHQYPNPSLAGTPAGWTPASVHPGDLVITEPGLYQDIEVTGSVEVRAPDVHLDRVRVHGRIWNQWPGDQRLAQFFMIVSNSTVGDLTPEAADVTQHGAIGPGNYRALANEVYGSDGFRVSAPQELQGGDGAVHVIGNYFRAADVGGDCGLHIDGVQGYFGGPGTVVDHNTLDATGRDCVTGVIFFADFSEGAQVTNNLLMAPNYPLRPQEDPGTTWEWDIRGNALVTQGNSYTVTSGLDCAAETTVWGHNHAVSVDSGYVVTEVGAEIDC